MALLTRAVTGVLAVGSLLSMTLLPASASGTVPELVAAETAGLTILTVGSATLELTGGGVPAYDPENLSVVVGLLPMTTVTDQRVSGATWSVSISATDFSHAADSGVQVPRGAARIYLDATTIDDLRIDLIGLGLLGSSIDTAVLRGDVATTLAGSYVLLSGESGPVGSTILFQPAMELAIPAATPVGSYSSVITQSIS
jgi:hypothetical protein